MTDRISGKSIIVTGAGSGFGRLISEKAAALGAKLVCADIDPQAAEAVASGIRNGGGIALGLGADVTRIDDMRAAVLTATDRHGSLDVLVNNAGTMPLAFLSDHATALESWSRCIDINFKGVLNGVVAAFDQMMEQGRGHIVNLSSIYGNHPVVGAAVYGATKAAIDYFSHSLRQESRGRIKVTLIKPTGVPGTGLGSTVVNRSAGIGIVGQNSAVYGEVIRQLMSGGLPPEIADPESIGYGILAPDYIADAVIYAIDQPDGVTVSDMTIRASGDLFVL